MASSQMEDETHLDNNSQTTSHKDFGSDGPPNTQNSEMDQEEKPLTKSTSAADFLFSAIQAAGPSAVLPTKIGRPQSSTNTASQQFMTLLKPATKSEFKVKTEELELGHPDFFKGMNYVAENDDFKEKPTGLVTLRYIQSFSPCPGDKKLWLAHLDGWQVAVPQGKFAVEEAVLFFAPDAFVTKEIKNHGAVEHWQFGVASEKYQGHYGSRVTIRPVGNTYSHGALAKLDLFDDVAEKIIENLENSDHRTIPDYLDDVGKYVDPNEIDFTQDLGVLKWRLDSYTALHSLGSTPRFVPKVDITNGNDCPNFFKKNKYKTIKYQETSKMDGATMSIYYIQYGSKWVKSLNPLPKYFDQRMIQKNGRLGVCSRNEDRNSCDPTQPDYFWEAVDDKLIHAMAALRGDLVVQGELIGPKVSGNAHRFHPDAKHRFLIFGAFDLKRNKPMNPREVFRWTQEWNLEHVEVRRYVTIRQIAEIHADLNLWAEMTNREGLVYKAVQGDHENRWFKSISSRYVREKDKALAGGGEIVDERSLEEWEADYGADRQFWEEWHEKFS